MLWHIFSRLKIYYCFLQWWKPLGKVKYGIKIEKSIDPEPTAVQARLWSKWFWTPFSAAGRPLSKSSSHASRCWISWDIDVQRYVANILMLFFFSSDDKKARSYLRMIAKSIHISPPCELWVIGRRPADFLKPQNRGISSNSPEVNEEFIQFSKTRRLGDFSGIRYSLELSWTINMGWRKIIVVSATPYLHFADKILWIRDYYLSRKPTLAFVMQNLPITQIKITTFESSSAAAP